MIRDSWRIVHLGLKSLMLHKLRSSLTTAGILFGVASVIAMLAVGEGAKREALERFRDMGVSNLIARSKKPAETQSSSTQSTWTAIAYGLLYSEADLIQASLPSAQVVRIREIKRPMMRGEYFHTSIIVGTEPMFLEVANMQIREGRWLTSTDEGLHWTESQLKLPGYTTYQGRQMEYDNEVGFFQESFTHLNGAGELLQWIRLDRGSPMYAMHADKPTGNDNADRLIFTKSTDGGLTWSNVEDFPKYTGTLEPYGQMYPRVTPLHQGRTLMTYTKRSGTPPLGLRAVLSTDGGDTFDFQNDVLILDENTQPGWPSGGGFGNTVQLPDGSLISCYSYATSPQTDPYTEVVRWRLP